MKTILLVLAGLAVHGATITSTSSYQAALGPDGIFSMPVYAPRFDSTLGTLTNFRVIVAVGVNADVTLRIGNTGGDLDALFSVVARLRWPSNPQHGQRDIAGNPVHVDSVSPQTDYFFPSAINGSTVVGVQCGSYLMCDALPVQGDYPFFLDIIPYRKVLIQHTYELAGTVTADLTNTYVYTPAQAEIHNPEPASWALMAIGLSGLAYWRRRRA